MLQALRHNFQKLSMRHLIGIGLTPVLLSILLMGAPIPKVFAIIIFALYLFATEVLPIDMTALLIMILVTVSGLVGATEGISGFSNPATITVLSMFILSAGIERTGIINYLGRLLFRLSGKSHIRQILIIALIIAPISGIINNTASVAVFLPMIIHLAKESKTPVTKLLIPLSFMSMLGGTLTLLGTSTNILANASYMQYGFDGIGIFDFTHIGFIILITGIVYFLLIGRFLLPVRKNEGTDDAGLPTDFIASIQIQDSSPFIGKKLANINFQEKFGVKVLKLNRGGKSFVKAAREMKILADDILVIQGEEQQILTFDSNPDARLLVDFDNPQRVISGGRIVKLLLKSKYLFEEKTISEIDFWNRYTVSVIGIHRDKLRKKHLSDMVIRQGEILLTKVSNTNLKRLQKSDDFVVLEEIEDQYNENKVLLAFGIIATVVLLAAFNVVPIVIAALIGVFLMFLTRCLTPREVYEAVNWDIIFLLAGVIPLGIAMQKSGGADLIAQYLVGLSDVLHPILLLGAFYLITTILTEIISNNAAVVLLIPIGISTALTLHLNPLAFVLAVMFAASTSFLSPIGYQTNTMVYRSGNYRFSDFIVVGAPLNAILMVVTTISIYYFIGL